MEKYQESYSKERCCTGHDYMCNQCKGLRMTEEMADERICEECVQTLRELQMVDLKQLLKTMQDEDIDDVRNEIKFEELDNELDKILKAATMGEAEQDGLRDVIIDEIVEWNFRSIEKGHHDEGELADRIINLIQQ